MENELDDFFAKKEDETPDLDLTKKPSKKIVPKEYLPIKFSSMGKLSIPSILHVRNFNMDEAIELSLTDENNILETTMAVLNSMIYENIDPQYLHEEELKEIMLNIFANFWGSTLENYFYPYEEEELTDPNGDKTLIEKIKKADGDFYPKVSIDVENIKTIPIRDKFKEPIIIKKDGQTVHFRLTRIKDIIEAKEYINKRYIKADQKFSDVINKIRKKKEHEISPERIEEYKKLQKQKMKDIAKVVEASTIIKFNSKTYQKLSEKITAVSKIPIGFWKKFSDITSDLKFGLNENVKVISPIIKKEVTRRFQFRFMDFIESLELQDDSGYDVSFGN